MALLAGLLICAACQQTAPEPRRRGLKATIKSQMDRVEARQTLVVEKERVHATVALPRFYEARGDRPAWLKRGCPSAQAKELAEALRSASEDGLRPSDYHTGPIASLLEQANQTCASGGSLDAKAATNLELLLSDGFALFAAHLLGGRINPATLDPEWHAQRRELDVVALLEEARARGAKAALARARPTEPGYRRLQQALARYRELDRQGGYKPVGEPLKRDAEGAAVERLRARLAADALLDKASGARFDADVEAAVRLFQQRHGLKQTGEVDGATLAQLDVPLSKRIEQLEVNLERWRWLPQSLGARYVMAKIPSFELVLVEQERVALRMRAVVGKLYRRTPMLSSTIKTVVLNPSWSVPHKIAVRDIAKEMRKDPGYLKKKGITIHAGWDPNAPTVDPKTIAWSRVKMSNFKYRLRQRPGKENALGRIKFMFPNKSDVYLHDTPIKHLFGEEQRALSSGCIRLERAMELAERLFDGKKGWTKEKLHAALARRGEQTLALPEPVPVHLTYFTAWVEDDGSLHFRKDIYRRDRRLVEALDKNPPRAAVRRPTDRERS